MAYSQVSMSRAVKLMLQITLYGMNTTVGPLVYRMPQGSNQGKRKFSNATTQIIDREVLHVWFNPHSTFGQAKILVDEAYQTALDLVKTHREEVP